VIDINEAWISIKDRIPMPGQNVLLYRNFGDIGNYFINHTDFESEDDYELNKITHWIALKPPVTNLE
jgi:hypothetical protein